VPPVPMDGVISSPSNVPAPASPVAASAAEAPAPTAPRVAAAAAPAPIAPPAAVPAVTVTPQSTVMPVESAAPPIATAPPAVESAAVAPMSPAASTQAPAPTPAAPVPTAAPAPPPEAAAVPAASAGAVGELDATALRRIWPEVLEVVKRSSRRTRALLDNAQIATAQGVQVTLAAPTALAKMINEESNTSILRAALTEVVGGDWKVTAEPGVGTPPPSDLPDDPDGGAALRATAAAPEPDPRDNTDLNAQPEPGSVHDQEAQTMRLLHDELGARPVEG
jgi:DNA polymerase-3 subunit gamma/tau